MKKLIALLLAAVMCLSLCACGSSEVETNTDDSQELDTDISQQDEERTEDTADESEDVEAEPQEQTVEITLENWQDYFELRQIAEENTTTNAYGEESSYIRVVHALCLKDEIKNNVEIKDSIVFDVDYGDCFACVYTYNMDTKELTVREYTEDDIPKDSENNDDLSWDKLVFESLGEINMDGTVSVYPDDVINGNGFDSSPTFYNYCFYNGDIVEVYGAEYSSIEITRIQGTIYIAE